jgi:Ethanolamine utilization protein EutJ (predicted chaperonin)
MSEAQYIVGIDLGTTNTVVSYVEKNAEVDSPAIQLLDILQITEPGGKNELKKLPSFLLQPLETEREQQDYTLPWAKGPWVVGAHARDRGAEVPGRFVSSAKSWLCQSGVDRKEAFLPFKSEDDCEKISPFKATTKILEHLRGVWSQKMNCALADQEVVLTVPASFDEQARKLTEEAARDAGISQLTILEEPQAALYAWLAEEGEHWREAVNEDDVILVCDVGGGTSDFSLITVTSEGGNLSLERTAVGEHILLGGDNMDLALAYRAKAKMEEKKKLNTSQMRSLWFQARAVKEDLLSGKSEKAILTVLGTGLKKLIGGTIKAEFDAQEALDFLVEGFLPKCALADQPQTPQTVGVQEVGLPYASDAAITKHLAQFISKQSWAENFKWPNKVLFNGGVFNCPAMRGRLLEVLNQWMVTQGSGEVSLLNYRSLDDAVAVGASYYGWSRMGKGIRIRAGISRSYYIEVASSMPAIPGMEAPKKAYCVAPFGMEEGSELSLKGETYALTTGRSAQFAFLSSTLRQEDSAGVILEDWEEGELEPAASMEVVLENSPDLGNPVPVTLGARVTEVGTLELYFEHAASGKRWRLEYQVRDK